MSITIRYNGSSIHLQGIAAVTPFTGDGEDNGSGVVAYYAESACGSLTRNGYRMATGKTFETAAEALEGAREMATYSHGLKVCKNCEKAAKWAASCEVDTESEEFAAEKARVNAELEESTRRYEAAVARREETPEAEAPAVDEHASAVARMRANREAEEEERAAARRARNRTNYAPAPEAHEDTTITREPEDRTLTEVEEMDDRYQDLILIGQGLRRLSDDLCASLARRKDAGMTDDHPRLQRLQRKLNRSLNLEDANVKERQELGEAIREARKTGRCLMRGGEYGGPSLQCLQLRGHSGDCKNSRGETFTNWLDPKDAKPFHHQVKDDINLKW